MTIKGLNGDLYFANNPIFITFDNIDTTTKYIEYFPSGLGLAPIKLYTKGRTSITVNIAELIKLAFQEVNHNTDYTTLTPFAVANNWAKVTLIVKEVGGISSAPPFTFSRTYVNGGNRTYDKNQNTSIGTPLAPMVLSEGSGGVSISILDNYKIPVWGGYPVDYYYFNSNKEMFKSNRIPSQLIEQRAIKGCEPVYLKFKNSKGGYSYWLFENSEPYTKGRNLGVVEREDNFLDLGNNVDAGIEVTSKVPRRYIGYMMDLTDSNEIYIYKGNNTWEKVINDNNEVKHNPYNSNEKIKLKFKKVHRYNPTLIW